MKTSLSHHLDKEELLSDFPEVFLEVFIRESGV